MSKATQVTKSPGGMISGTSDSKPSGKRVLTKITITPVSNGHMVEHYHSGDYEYSPSHEKSNKFAFKDTESMMTHLKKHLG